MLLQLSLLLLSLNTTGGPLPPAALRRQLATASDTTRIRLLRQLADHYLYANFDSAWTYARQEHALARRNH